jgi:hypothetical protein
MVGRVIHNNPFKKCTSIWGNDLVDFKGIKKCWLTRVIIKRNEEAQVPQNDFDVFVAKQFYAFLEDTGGDVCGLANMVLHQSWRQCTSTKGN